MPKTQPFAHNVKLLPIEWEQAFDEGRDVAAYEEKACREIAQRAEKGEDCTAQAEALYLLLQDAPVLAEYTYVEPSDLEGICAAKPAARHAFSCTLSPEELKEKLAGAWVGRIAGCLLGKPVEGYLRDKLYPLLKMTDNYPLSRFIERKEFTKEVYDVIGEDQKSRCWADTLEGAAPVDDDTNYTVFSLKLVETYGRDFKPGHVMNGWLSWIPIYSTFTAERIAYRNAIIDLTPPDTATYHNPCREWIGAQIRADLFGYINPGNPAKAAEMAWRDASISHVKNGIYGEMFVAAMLAAACVSDDIMTVIEAGLDEIPANCRLRRDIEKVISWYKEGVSSDEAIERIHKAYNEKTAHGWCHTNSNAMIVALGLLYGEKDYGKSICLAVQAAFDTDCNGATVGSIVGMMLGEANIPDVWTACWNKRLTTTIIGYPDVSVADLVDRTYKLIG